MSITKILANEDMSDSAKLSNINDIVSAARSSYDNEDATISSPDINTTDGMISFSHLTDEAKVYILSSEINRIRASAIEYARHTEGANINKKLEELIATNPMLCNLDSGTDLSYI